VKTLFSNFPGGVWTGPQEIYKEAGTSKNEMQITNDAK